MSFGAALERMKAGYKMTRKGWNGKGMFVFMTPSKTIKTSELERDCARYYYECAGKHTVKIAGHIDMKSADDTYIVGWCASQTDMLAEDWEIFA